MLANHDYHLGYQQGYADAKEEISSNSNQIIVSELQKYNNWIMNKIKTQTLRYDIDNNLYLKEYCANNNRDSWVDLI